MPRDFHHGLLAARVPVTPGHAGGSLEMASELLVSVVIPVLRDTAPLEALLETLSTVGKDEAGSRSGSDFEVVVANGDPADETLTPLRQRFPRVRWTDGPAGRAVQMNAGAARTRGRWLLFLHADTRPDPSWLEEFRRLDRQHPSAVGGAFTLRFRHPAAVARILERGVALRVRWCGLPYGDQGIFVRHDVFNAIGGYSDLPIMEDIDLVLRVRRAGPLVWSPVTIEVSPRRWERDGWIRRSVLNLLLVGLFFVGVAPTWLAERYYRKPAGSPAQAVDAAHAADLETAGTVAVIIPALNEQQAIVEVIDEIPALAGSVTVVDNGSTDDTAALARSRGARVVAEPRRGYGRACLAGLRANPDADIIVFLDADRSDYPTQMTSLVAPIVSGDADLVLGCRAGAGRPLTARLGTGLCVTLINWLWKTSYQDLGPFRAISRRSLDRLGMTDETWGWTIEMQVKAAEAGLRVVERPVGQRPRVGKSKISGTVVGTVRAGSRMLATIWSLWRTQDLRAYRA